MSQLKGVKVKRKCLSSSLPSNEVAARGEGEVCM